MCGILGIIAFYQRRIYASQRMVSSEKTPCPACLDRDPFFDLLHQYQ